MKKTFTFRQIIYSFLMLLLLFNCGYGQQSIIEKLNTLYTQKAQKTTSFSGNRNNGVVFRTYSINNPRGEINSIYKGEVKNELPNGKGTIFISSIAGFRVKITEDNVDTFEKSEGALLKFEGNFMNGTIAKGNCTLTLYPNSSSNYIQYIGKIIDTGFETNNIELITNYSILKISDTKFKGNLTNETFQNIFSKGIKEESILNGSLEFLNDQGTLIQKYVGEINMMRYALGYTINNGFWYKYGKSGNFAIGKVENKKNEAVYADYKADKEKVDFVLWDYVSNKQVSRTTVDYDKSMSHEDFYMKNISAGVNKEVIAQKETLNSLTNEYKKFAYQKGVDFYAKIYDSKLYLKISDNRGLQQIKKFDRTNSKNVEHILTYSISINNKAVDNLNNDSNFISTTNVYQQAEKEFVFNLAFVNNYYKMDKLPINVKLDTYYYNKYWQQRQKKNMDESSYLFSLPELIIPEEILLEIKNEHFSLIKAKQDSEFEARQNAEKERIAKEKYNQERIKKLKVAQVGDRICFSQGWIHHKEYKVFLGVGNVESQNYTMRVISYVERKEGDRFQIRIANIESSNRDNWSYPKLNGVELKEQSLHWIKPTDYLNNMEWSICD